MKKFVLLGVNYPWATIVVGLILVGLMASGLPKLHKDTSADAFLAKDNPALVYKNKARELFGISDPIVIAIEDHSSQGIYRASTLKLIRNLTEAVNELGNVNEQRTMSLATEENIVGTSSGLEVYPFMDLEQKVDTDAIRNAISEFPLYDGLLVSKDGAMTLIIVEMMDDNAAEKTYQEIDALTNNVAVDAQVQIYTAGEGAVLGYLGNYIDRDASRLNPLAGLIITVMLFVAFRRFAPALLGNLIIAATVLMTLGFMATSAVPFFVITNAMPVILIGIAVADSIHIFSQYYEIQARNPELPPRDAIEQALLAMFWPVTLTTLTTIAGFFGLYASAYMPPFEYFGLFTGFGVMVAWLYSIFLLPAAIVLAKPKVSKRWIELERNQKSDLFSRVMKGFGTIATRHTGKTLILFLIVSLAGMVLSARVQVNENRINTFHHDEPVFIADQVINQHMEGTNTLDVVIEASTKEGLFKPDLLHRIDALQRYAESLPHVNGSIALTDYLKQINKALHEDKHAFYRLPESSDLVAQYFLLYAASGDPEAFESVVDYDYRIANVRFYLDTSEYVVTAPIIESLQAYVDDHFNTADASATLTGRVNVNYHWIKDIGSSHFLSVLIALMCVLIVSVLLLRSLIAGLLALVPVIFSILAVYAAMVLLKIDLGIGTSMFASVAIGLGVDFAIHTIERLKQLFIGGVPSVEEIVEKLYASTGRALLFNFLAIAFGFGVLISSKVVPLNNFGTIVVLSVTMSFISSLLLVPALVLYFKPSYFYGKHKQTTADSGSPRKVAPLLSILIVIGALGAFPCTDAAAESLSAQKIVENINAVNDGQHVVSDLMMTLIDKSGKTRSREAVSYRKYFGDEKRTQFLYQAPSNVKGTSFLTYDYADRNKSDDQWLYLPALRKVRRIPSSDRGDYFLGTDFSYEDIKQAGRIESSDFDFQIQSEQKPTQENQDPLNMLTLEATPISEKVAQELGYGKVLFWVNPQNWVIYKAEYWDVKQRPLKTLMVSDVRQVNGIWTRHRLEIVNHKSGHISRFEFSNVDYVTPVNDSIFTRRFMERGA